MDFETLLQKVIILAREHFSEKKKGISEATTADEISKWNSLSHVMLIAAIEKEFGIKFDLLQMIDMKSIGDIARATYETLK
jgi:acyl carrier protein